jgi:hypothetical protein
MVWVGTIVNLIAAAVWAAMGPNFALALAINLCFAVLCAAIALRR